MKLPKLRTVWRGATLQRDFEELKGALGDYIKDETVVPIRAMGRFLAFGALGSIFVGLGFVFLLVGTLRYLQWQFPFFDGSESWIPYTIVVISGIVAIGIVVKRIFVSVGERRSGRS